MDLTSRPVFQSPQRRVIRLDAHVVLVCRDVALVGVAVLALGGGRAELLDGGERGRALAYLR